MKKIFLALFLFFSVFPLTASAAVAARTGCPTSGLVPCGGTGCPCTLCDLFVMFDNIIKFLLLPPGGLVPIIAVLMILIGGFMYVIAYMNPEGGPGMITKAKSLFKAVAIGLLIAYGAWLIVNLFFMVIGASDWTGLQNGWWKVNCN